LISSNDLANRLGVSGGGHRRLATSELLESGVTAYLSLFWMFAQRWILAADPSDDLEMAA
jgi:hypothetical protein